MPTLPKRVSNTGYSCPGVTPPSISPRGRQTLRYLPTSCAVGADQHGDVVDQVPVAFDQAGDDVQVVLLAPARRSSRSKGRGSARRTRASDRAGAVVGERLGQHDQVGLLPGGLGDQRRELPAVLGAASCPLSGGSARSPDARVRGAGGGTCRERDVGPLDLCPRRPAEVQFDHRLAAPSTGPDRRRRPRSSRRRGRRPSRGYSGSATGGAPG